MFNGLKTFSSDDPKVEVMSIFLLFRTFIRIGGHRELTTDFLIFRSRFRTVEIRSLRVRSPSIIEREMFSPQIDTGVLNRLEQVTVDQRRLSDFIQREVWSNE